MAAPTSAPSLYFKRIIRSYRNTIDMVPPFSFLLPPSHPAKSRFRISSLRGPLGFHICVCVSISNFDSFVRSLKVAALFWACLTSSTGSSFSIG